MTDNSVVETDRAQIGDSFATLESTGGVVVIALPGAAALAAPGYMPNAGSVRANDQGMARAV